MARPLKRLRVQERWPGMPEGCGQGERLPGAPSVMGRPQLCPGDGPSTLPPDEPEGCDSRRQPSSHRPPVHAAVVRHQEGAPPNQTANARAQERDGQQHELRLRHDHAKPPRSAAARGALDDHTRPPAFEHDRQNAFDADERGREWIHGTARDVVARRQRQLHILPGFRRSSSGWTGSCSSSWTSDVTGPLRPAPGRAT
jgi:hypothetical protein